VRRSFGSMNSILSGLRLEDAQEALVGGVALEGDDGLRRFAGDQGAVAERRRLRRQIEKAAAGLQHGSGSLSCRSTASARWLSPTGSQGWLAVEKPH